MVVKKKKTYQTSASAIFTVESGNVCGAMWQVFGSLFTSNVGCIAWDKAKGNK